jgi:tryptophanyl-tRNA synthetase
MTLCIVDLHSITVPQVPSELRENSLRLCASLLACGIDPQKSTLFLQSNVKEHTELSWILGCITTMARLTHLPQYKEKSAKMKEVPLGLYLYPVLQAADILLYKATHVPVGEDQAQHLQLAMSLAKLFNHRFGQTFPIIKPIIADDSSSRIKSLRDPTKKMSKSDPDKKSTIMITDTPEMIKEKLKKAVTDCTSAVTFEPEGRPGVANLLTMHSMVIEYLPEEIVEEVEGLDTGK